jgi:hypothetical protein
MWRIGLTLACGTGLMLATPGQAQQPPKAPQRTRAAPVTSTPAPGTTAPSAPAPSTKAPGAPAPASTASAGNGRPAPTAQGAGTFVSGGWRLTTYGCYRGGTRLLCDFDLAAVNGTSGQTDVSPFGAVSVVDGSGKITVRHDAYFVATDGSRMNRAFFSSTPVRYVMEYDNVAQQSGSVSLANGGTVVKNVPVAPLKGNLDLGSFVAGGWRLSLYGCYRSGTRVLCDFDLATINGWSGQTNVGPFAGLSLIDSGGRITGRSDAYFMGSDGSRMDLAFASSTAVRYLMEFDNVAVQVAKVGLANGGYQVPNVPVTTPGQGSAVPARAPMVWPDRTDQSLGLASLPLGGNSSGSVQAGQTGQPAQAAAGTASDGVSKASDAASQAVQGVQSALDLFKKKK